MILPKFLKINSLIFTFALSSLFGFSSEPEAIDYGTRRLQSVHNKLRLLYGSFQEEYPEQLMTAMYLPSDAKVLELGANVGRNSCVIASLLSDSRNLVSVESCPDSARYLQKNRDHNRLKFHIEASAVSKIPLIQRGWFTIPGNEVLPGYVKVKTITFDQLQRKYKITFDTLVADCEGALYYILRDDPAVLNNIKLVIVENDYPDANHRNYVESQFLLNGLELVYNSGNFYQVWKK